MDGVSRVELELVQTDLSIEAVFNVLVEGCWVEKDDYQKIVFSDSIEFQGGLYDSFFKLTIANCQMIVESDSPWELEVLLEELKGLVIKRSPLLK